MGLDAQGVLAQARAACAPCPLRASCAIAPLHLQAEARPGERRRHPHARVLGEHLARLREVAPRVERELLTAMGGADEGLALVAGCLLAEGFWTEPGKLCRLLEGIASKGPEARVLSSFEEQLIRAGALLQDPAVPPLLRGRYRVKRGDREISVYEAVRLVTRLIGGEAPSVWFTEAVAEEDRSGFEGSFALREKAIGDESEHGGAGAIDVFFSSRGDGVSTVYYYRRDGAGKQALVPIEAIRPDSLLTRLFKVFYTDPLKTHRLFAKICRFLNNGFKGLDKRMLWEGLKRLDREQQIVLALYAPRLGKYIEKRAEFPGLYRLSKFLHKNVTDKSGKAPAHARIFAQRKLVHDIIELYGRQTFKQFCTDVFRIAEATPDGAQWSDLIYKIGEVAYFLTAIEGFNPAGLELSLNGKNPLAFIAYGMQPAAKAPQRRLQRLREARARIERLGDAPATKGLLAAVDQGLAYLAEVHGYPDAHALEQALGAHPAPSPR